MWLSDGTAPSAAPQSPWSASPADLGEDDLDPDSLISTAGSLPGRNARDGPNQSGSDGRATPIPGSISPTSLVASAPARDQGRPHHGEVELLRGGSNASAVRRRSGTTAGPRSSPPRWTRRCAGPTDRSVPGAGGRRRRISPRRRRRRSRPAGMARHPRRGRRPRTGKADLRPGRAVSAPWLWVSKYQPSAENSPRCARGNRKSSIVARMTSRPLCPRDRQQTPADVPAGRSRSVGQCGLAGGGRRVDGDPRWVCDGR